MYCRGKDTRREIVKNYELHPLAYVQLLTGQTKKSCTGDALTNAYYCFHYKSRKDANEGTMLCGEHAAKDFLQLISHPGLAPIQPAARTERKGRSGHQRNAAKGKNEVGCLGQTAVRCDSSAGRMLGDLHQAKHSSK